MYEFYRTPVPVKALKTSRRDLNNIYSDIPQTKGCMESLPTCGAWCCEHQNPSLFYAEFLNTYWHINQTWSPQQLAALFMRAVRSYISAKPTKGCVFWDSTSKHCMQHETRPFNCRTYGQVPKEDFKPRYERLKILHEKNPEAVVREQCDLVKTDGTPPTSAQMNEWFNQIKLVEKDIGMPSALINDGDGGSYRNYQDHLLLQMSPPSMLERLTKLRLKASESEKEAFLLKMEADLKDELNGTDKSKAS